MAEAADDACASCALNASRRDFIRAGVVAVFGAMSVGWIDAFARNGTTVSYAIPADDGAQIDKANEVILVRWASNIYAFNLSCPHQHTSLRWIDADKRFQCPKHKSKYQPDGTFISGKATRGMDRFSLKREGASIVVDLKALHKQPNDPAGYAAAVVRLGDS